MEDNYNNQKSNLCTIARGMQVLLKSELDNVLNVVPYSKNHAKLKLLNKSINAFGSSWSLSFGSKKLRVYRAMQR